MNSAQEPSGKAEFWVKLETSAARQKKTKVSIEEIAEDIAREDF